MSGESQTCERCNERDALWLIRYDDPKLKESIDKRACGICFRMFLGEDVSVRILRALEP
jgi:hypothetical protein